MPNLTEIDLMPFVKVKTKKLFERGGSVNGKHQEDWRHLELVLDVYTHPFKKVFCADCKSEILRGDVFAWNQMEYPRCLSCVVMPDYPIEARKVVFKYKGGRTIKGKDTFSVYRVQTPQRLDEYFYKIALHYDVLEALTLNLWI